MTETRTLNILLTSHGLPPESVGGVEQHVDGLARALFSQGHAVEVYAKTGGDGEQGLQRAEPGHPYPVTRVVYRYEGLDSLASLYRQPVLDTAFDAFLADRSFDVVHLHHFTGMSTGLLDVLAARGIPSVVTLHDYWLMCPRGQMWHRRGERCERVEVDRCADCLAPTFGGWLPADRRGEIVGAVHREARELLEKADSLVTPSARAIPPFEALGVPRDRIPVVENGVDTEGLQSVPPLDPAASGPLRIGYLGTLIPSKGLDVLVDALQRLPAGMATLDIWGNAVPYHGDDGFLTRTFARLRPGAPVTYHGPYLPADLPRILARIDALAAPALWSEAFGLTPREAAAAGRPVVVSRVGALQDAVQNGVEGFVVEPGDPAALATALAELAGDRQRLCAMGTAARSRSRGFAAMARDLVTIYTGVARS